MKQYTTEVFLGVSEAEANLILEAFKKVFSDFHIQTRYQNFKFEMTIFSRLSPDLLSKWFDIADLFLELHKDGRLMPLNSEKDALNISQQVGAVHPGLTLSISKPYREEGMDYEHEAKAREQEISDEAWDYDDEYDAFDDYSSYSAWPYEEDDFDDGP